MVAADGTYSIPPSFADAGGMAGNAKHARVNTMAQTITLLELIIKLILYKAVASKYSNPPKFHCPIIKLILYKAGAGSYDR